MAPVQRVGDQDPDVVDAVVGQHLQHDRRCTRSRTSGSFIGGSGSEMSSIDDRHLHPGVSSA
jgi:hypothetical protein